MWEDVKNVKREYKEYIDNLKNIRRKYGRNRYRNMSEEDNPELREYHNLKKNNFLFEVFYKRLVKQF